MRRTAIGLLWGLLLGIPMAGSAGERAAGDDDLAVVKKATAPEPSPAAKESKTRRSEPQWLKVRIVEGGAHKSRVTVNLPLAMIRALGDDLPVDLGSTHLRLSEVLRTLESGEPLALVKSPDSTVRVWVE